MRKILSFIVALAFSVQSWAAPTVSSVSGTFGYEQAIYVSGSDFGTKIRNKPFFYGDWQDGSIIGDPVASNSSTIGIQNYTIVTDNSNMRWGNGYIVKSNWTRDGTATGRSATLNLDVTTYGAGGSKMYVAGWRKWVNGDTNGNWKLLRKFSPGGAGTYPNGYIGNGDIANTGNWSWNLENQGNINGGTQKYGSYSVPTSTYRLEEYFFKHNTPGGTQNGSIDIRLNNSTVVSDSSFAFDYASLTGPIRHVYFQDTKTAISNPDPGASMASYISELYIDDSWNRVVIGNASTYSACTQLEIQPFTFWSNTSITVRLRPGAFANATGKFLFVVDNDNNASSGFALSSLSGAPAPSVASVTPDEVSTAGGTSVALTGANLVSGVYVKVGTTTATSTTYISPTSLTFVSPGLAPGFHDVVAYNPDLQTGTLSLGIEAIAPTPPSGELVREIFPWIAR
jgi:hypothetical protein